VARQLPNPPRALFDAVPNIIREKKFLGVGLNAVLEPINKGGRDRSIPHRTISETTLIAADVTLRLVVVGQPAHFDSWNVSLLIYNRRIDGFGWEQGFRDIHGTRHSGWHRHFWDEEEQHAYGKVLAIPWSSEMMTMKEFVMHALSEMNVCWEDDNETLSLF
jgi:hypothetical protein